MSAPKPQSFAEALEARPSDQLAGSLAATSVRFAPETWSEEDGSFDAVLNTGGWVDRWSYGRGAYKLRLGMEPGQVDLTRANLGAPVLDSHNSWKLSDQIGVIVPNSARVVDGVGIVARPRLSARPEVAGIRQDVKDGIIRNGSVGAQIHSTTVELIDGMEWHTATAWSLLEFSLVSVPADAGAQVLSAHGAERMEVESMATETPAAPAVEIDHEALRAEARAEGARLEATRQTEIRSAAARLKLTGDSPELAKLLADPSVSVDKAREAIIELRAQADEKGPRTSPHISMGRTDGEHFTASVEKGLLSRMGHGVDLSGDELARRIVGRGPMWAAEQCLRRAGVDTESMSRTQIARTALMHSTSDFPLITANSARKRLTAGYEAEQVNYPAFCMRQDLPDLKTASIVKTGDSPSLAAIAEGGEYTHGTVSEGAETWNLAKYGRQIRLTMEALINDDLGAFSRDVFRFGGAAARKEMDIVWGILTGNPAMADGNPLFHASHSNVITSGAAPSVAQIEAMQRLMRVQTGLDGAQLSIRMRHILVPTALNLATMQALGLVQGFVPTTATNAIPNGFAFNVIAEPRLDAASAVIYYGVADPSQAETIVYGYLQGEAGPVLEQDQSFDTDSMAVKARLFFGAKAVEHRSFVRNAGA